MIKAKLYEHIASIHRAINACVETGNVEWEKRHEANIADLIVSFMPSGAGFDYGFDFDQEQSKDNRLIFYFDYHHMDDVGYYVGWSSHTVTVVPDLVSGIDIHISEDVEFNKIMEEYYQTRVQELKDQYGDAWERYGDELWDFDSETFLDYAYDTINSALTEVIIHDEHGFHRVKKEV